MAVFLVEVNSVSTSWWFGLVLWWLGSDVPFTLYKKPGLPIPPPIKGNLNVSRSRLVEGRSLGGVPILAHLLAAGVGRHRDQFCRMPQKRAGCGQKTLLDPGPSKGFILARFNPALPPLRGAGCP